MTEQQHQRAAGQRRRHLPDCPELRPWGHGISVAVGDFNGDGKPDLAVANNYSNTYGTGTASVLLGNGDGTFQTPQNFAAGTSPESVGVGDFNGDGKPDLAVADLTNINPTVSVLLNQLVTTTAVSGPTSSTYGQSVTYTASVTNGSWPDDRRHHHVHGRQHASQPRAAS